jgi:NADPH2:quinone reductase
LRDLIEKGLLKSTVFEREYRGLESVGAAMKDLAERKVWGKAVILIEPENRRPKL